MQPKNDTFICIVTYEGPLGPVGQVVNVILQTLVIIFELNCPLNFRFVRERNRMPREAAYAVIYVKQEKNRS